MNEYLIQLGKQAKKASYQMSQVDMNVINQTLLEIANQLEIQSEAIIQANDIDVSQAKSKIDHVMLDRLTLNTQRVQDLADNLRNVALLESPLGKVEYSYQSLKGYRISNITVPLGVIAMIYEARPNVTTEAMSLALKSGNVIILRGSSTTLNTNKKLLDIITNVGKQHGLPDYFCQLVESIDHQDVNELVKMNEYLDVLIPRGGAKLIQNVVENARVPIIETGIGNNFAYIDESADIDQAIDVIINAKAQRVTVCNSLEKLLIHKDVSQSFFSKLEEALQQHNVVIKADPNIIDSFKDAKVLPTNELDVEYLDYIIGIMQVDSIEQAITIINQHSSKHSNLILSTNFYAIEKFTKEIDSACVFVNVSTRFADGVEFGLGSEIGISTQKLHARGPMGLKALTTTKSIVIGKYQQRH